MSISEIGILDITPSQCRAARGLLRKWSLRKLAKEVGLNVSTIHDFEIGSSKPKPGTMARLVDYFRGAGVQFGEKGWIRLQSDDSEMPPEPQSADRDQR
jgi:transcriptional regulator with XRE-family HTH domain